MIVATVFIGAIGVGIGIGIAGIMIGIGVGIAKGEYIIGFGDDEE